MGIVQFPVWRTITSVMYNSPDELFLACREIGGIIPYIGEPELPPAPDITVNLARVNPTILGLKEYKCGGVRGVPLQEYREKALSTGRLDLCPRWLAPQLFLQYDEQPPNEWIYMGMDTMTHECPDAWNGYQYIHGMHTWPDSYRWLSRHPGYPDSPYGKSTGDLIFVLVSK